MFLMFFYGGVTGKHAHSITMSEQLSKLDLFVCYLCAFGVIDERESLVLQAAHLVVIDSLEVLKMIVLDSELLYFLFLSVNDLLFPMQLSL